MRNYILLFLCAAIVLAGCSKNEYDKTELYSITDTLISIGGELDSSNYLSPTSILVDSEDNIYVLDYTDKDIKVYNPQGLFSYSFSREGNGPGELSLPNKMRFDNKGNIVVADLLNHRFSVFSKSGTYIKSISFTGWLSDFDIDDENNFYVEYRRYKTDENSSYVYDDTKLVMYDSSFNEISVIDSLLLRKRKMITDPIQMRITLPFSHDFLWELRNDGTLITLMTDSTNIKVYKKNVLISDSFRISETQVKVNQKDKIAYLESMIISSSGGSSKPSEELKSKFEFPSYKTYAKKILLSGDKFIIQTYHEENNKSLCNIFDPNLQEITSTFLSTKILDRLKYVTDTKLYTVEHDDNDFRILKVYKYAEN